MKKIFRRISAVVLAFVMTAGVIPTTVMADTEVGTVQESEVEVTLGLEVGKEYTINIAEDGAKEIWYQFTPAESGYYTVVSNGEYDSYCELYTSNKTFLESDDDSAYNSNFSLQYKMTAGTVYLYKFRMYNADDVGSYKVNLIKNAPATSMKLDSNSYTGYIGTNLDLNVEFLPESAAIEEVSWTSSDESVASVNEYGSVYLLSAGEAVITATSTSGFSATCNVTVKPAVDAALNTTYNISTDGENNRGVMYKFVPEESRYYRFYSFNGECDTYGELYDENFNELAEDDYSGDGNHFTIDYEMKAGEIYYIYVSPYDYTDIVSFDFAIKEINPINLSDIYFTVDNVKQENSGFTVTEANEVTLWFGFSQGDDIEISEVTWGGKRIDNQFNEESIGFTTEYDAEKNLYYTKIPSTSFIEGCDFSVNHIMVYDIKADTKNYHSINGTPLDTVFYFMGENNSAKTYKIEFSVLNETSEASVTTSRVTSLAEMGIEIPEVPVIEGAKFIGWDLLIGNTSYGLIKSNDQKFSISSIFVQGNDEVDITLEAKYDKNIVKGHFRYMDKDGNDAEKIVLGVADKEQEVTYAQWLESVIAGNQLNDIEHTMRFSLNGWKIADDSAEDTVASGYTEIYVDAEYVFDGIILGGVHIDDGDYLNNTGEVSKSKPEGGYGYYSDGKLTLHNYNYKGNGSNNINETCALYAGSDLEIILEGSNRLHCISDDVIYNESGNLTISGDGYLDIKAYSDYDGIDLVDGDLTIKSGVLTIESGDHGCEIDGAITIDGGIVKIIAGDDGMDFDNDFVINDGIVDIDTEDNGIDSSDSIYVKGGFIRVKTEDDEGLEAGSSIVIEDGNIVIDANGAGLYAFEEIEINGGYTQIKSGDYAVVAEYNINFGINMESFETIQLAEFMIGIGVNGEAVKEAVLKAKEATKLNYLEESWVSLSKQKIDYTGEEIKLDITITDGDKTLVEGTDYTISYSNEEIKDIGEYLIVISGKGNYSGVVIKKISVYEDIIYVGNTCMENGDYLAVGATETVDEKPESAGYAYYKDGILELNNYKYEGEGYKYNSEDYNAIIYAENGVEINLVGENSLINDSLKGEGISLCSSLKFSGNGSIYIESLYGVGTNEGDIVIESGDISISAVDDGIWAYGDFTVNDGNIDISAGNDCVFAENDITITGGSISLTDAETGDVDDYYGYGIYCYYGDIIIGGDADITIDTECGLYAYDYDIIIEGGRLDIAAEYGIWCDYRDIYINGGVLNMDSTYGVTAYTGIMFNGGLVNIKASDYAVKSCNIELGDGVKIIKPENGTIDTIEDIAYIFEGDGYASDVIIMSFDQISSFIEEKNADNVTSDDKKSIQSIVELIDDLLTEDCWTAEEKEFLENTKTDAASLIEKIDIVADALDTENIQKVEGINDQNVVLENMDDLVSAKEDLEKALEENAGNYTDAETQAAEDKIESIDKALEVIKNVQDVEQIITDLPDIADQLNDTSVRLIQSANDNFDELSDYEKSLVSEILKDKLESLNEILNSNYIIIYFDNSETNWKYVYVYYENENGSINPIGIAEQDENGICKIQVPADGRILFMNYLVGQPPEAAPPEGFMMTDFFDAVEGKTYKYEESISVKNLGDVNSDTKIDAQDALLVLKHAARLVTLTDEEVLAADVKADDIVNAEDALDILKYAARLIDSFQ